MKTFASLFTGGGGADIGARAAGLELAWGVELMPEIAEVGNANLGQHIQVANILDCDPVCFDRVDALHASPPCPNFSAAKANATETALDKALAAKVAEFVTTLRPEVFTLENVQAYQKSRSWAMIQDALHTAGYWVSVEVVNSADMAVPQTRKRMIVRAIRGGMVPYLPQPVRWVGWYAAIDDILDTLPESQFAPWQVARLPEELKTTLVDRLNGGHEKSTIRGAYEPAFTITNYDSKHQPPQAVLVSNAKTEYSDGTRQSGDPAFTVTGESNGRVKAFIVDCQNAGNLSPDRERGLTIRNGDQPCFTLTSSMGQKRPTRAFDGARVVAMTPRALARFQSFPDWYQLPDTKTLSAKIIGNAVPPLVMQRVYEGLLN